MNKNQKIFEEHIHIKLTKLMKDELHAIARKKGMTSSDLVRQKIREMIINENKF